MLCRSTFQREGWGLALAVGSAGCIVKLPGSWVESCNYIIDFLKEEEVP